MRSAKYKAILVVQIFTAIVLLSACKKGYWDAEGPTSKEISVTNVTLQSAATTTQVITQARVGTLVRINGKGFSEAKSVYMNGVKVAVNPGYVTETAIMVTIPSSLPFGKDITDTATRNTIRIITSNDDYAFKFLIQGPAPAISGVSHSLPKAGETVEIYGTNLRDLDTVKLPGNIVLLSGEFETSSDFSKLSFTMPAAAIASAGGIYVSGANGSDYLYNYMNRRNCIFIEKFSSDTAVSGGTGDCYQRTYNFGSSTISANQTAVLPATGTGHKNPATYRQFPATAATAAIDATVGSFDFRTCPAATSVLRTTGGAITTASACNNLALQFDAYIPVEWSCGFVRFEFVKGNTDWRYNYAPWLVNGSVKPVKMTGWQTISIPLSAFKALNGKTYQYLVDQAVSKGGYFAFINGSYTDASGKSWPPVAIPNFQMSFGNFRIVPYVKSL
ncbi:hypothetical protein HNQ91_000764 [Filimonas zeae]|uniref:Surface glycan-binding protein B xyloglucan binding domain-containing protein n=1 Tax=Filimonas zeae TaxID=1737353 RepID=A0A917IPU7_9BACT|nr:glycan-binding surface protein [Filimonas zeae]MDR6337742.1 hypothetical protein [Filimonas zeae]GGH60060.1 hypothetical protein GCM10011379_07490 [Filimonas zeae]